MVYSKVRQILCHSAHYRRAQDSFGLARLGLAWLGLAWLGLAWLGLAWLGLVWFGLVWFGLVWFGLVWFGLVWFGLVWFGLVWFRKACRCRHSVRCFCLLGCAGRLCHMARADVLQMAGCRFINRMVAVTIDWFVSRDQLLVDRSLTATALLI